MSNRVLWIMRYKRRLCFEWGDEKNKHNPLSKIFNEKQKILGGKLWVRNTCLT